MIWSVPDDPAGDQAAAADLGRLHDELEALLRAGTTDEDQLRGAIATGFLLNGLPPELALDFEKRLELLDLARTAATALELDETIVNALHRQSRLLLAAGDIGEARARLEEAEPLLDRAPAMRPWVLLDLGSCARLAGEWKAALAFIDRARASLDATAYPAHQLADTSILGELFEIHLGWRALQQGLAERAAGGPPRAKP